MSILSRAARTARAIRAAAAAPPFVAPGHFYSPMTSGVDVRRALAWEPEAPGVDMNEAGQLALAAELRPVVAQVPPGPRWTGGPENRMFGGADAAVYRAMLSWLRPERIIEVGSGFSTAIALDEGYQVTCVEPYPERLLTLTQPHDRVTLMKQPVQDVPLSLYASLGARDVLFIDSSHVAKAGSDVCWLLLHVLPRLAPGVVVHVHDVFWPFEYPAAWLAEHRDWTEDYLLHAFLSGNAGWEILWFSSWLWRSHAEMVPSHLQAEDPGSVWLRRH
jgi:Methyltransferase domain